ncbi:MAG: hypothetical protein Tsb009_28770 [Planctomycetaceae bacterium]
MDMLRKEIPVQSAPAIKANAATSHPARRVSKEIVIFAHFPGYMGVPVRKAPCRTDAAAE